MAVQTQSAEIVAVPLAVAEGVRGRRSRRHLLKKRNLLAGGTIVLMMVILAVFAPWIAPRGPQETDYGARLRAPSWQHLFGTDNLGKDVFSRVVYGARI